MTPARYWTSLAILWLLLLYVWWQVALASAIFVLLKSIDGEPITKLKRRRRRTTARPARRAHSRKSKFWQTWV